MTGSCPDANDAVHRARVFAAALSCTVVSGQFDPIGYITPTEAVEAFYANMNAVDEVA